MSRWNRGLADATSLADASRKLASNASITGSSSSASNEREILEHAPNGSSSNERPEGARGASEGDELGEHASLTSEESERVEHARGASYGSVPANLAGIKAPKKALARLLPPPKGPDKAQLNVRVDGDLHARFYRIARERGGGYGAIVRTLEFCLEVGLDRLEKG